MRLVCVWRKAFLNLEKNQIGESITEEKELTKQNEINNIIFTSCRSLFF